MAMDVHSRFRTAAHQDVVPRFNERFILSLAGCKNCLVLDDELNILPLSKHSNSIRAVQTNRETGGVDTDGGAQLKELVDSLAESQPVGTLVAQAKTLDQAKAIMTFIDAVSEKTLSSTVTLTASRGRGKSAALGIAIGGAVAYGYSNIFVTAPSPENLGTVFDFVFKTFDALKYKEHLDYEVIQSTNPDFNKAVIRVNIFREHRQTIQFIQPSDAERLSQAELLVIDEAAAIPLPLVRKLLGNYLVFMSSTINGYEGTGRSLSLKLIEKLRHQQSTRDARDASGTQGRVLREIELTTPIRYASGDGVERWLHDLLCLDASTSMHRIVSGCPHPRDCELYKVNRDALFSYHKVAEVFLQRMMSLYVASHYKNSPNDLQLLSDAPAHRLFVLLGPNATSGGGIPDILCVVQVALEGAIAQDAVRAELAKGQRAAGDLIPWTISQQYQDNEFASLSGARIVRIATHPDVMGMGYGSRAVELLAKYFQGDVVDANADMDTADASSSASRAEAKQNGDTGVASPDSQLLTEKLRPRKTMPALMERLGESPVERLHYLGVSFGLTKQLFNFWHRKKFSPVYLRQTANDLTGEFTCIMLCPLRCSDLPVAPQDGWLTAYRSDFKRRLVALLASAFRQIPVELALSLLDKKAIDELAGSAATRSLLPSELDLFLSPRDIKRMEAYSRNLVDYHMVSDLVPSMARLFFMGNFGGKFNLSSLQSAIFVGMGLQKKTIDDLVAETNLHPGQLLAMFNKAVRKVARCTKQILETDAAREVDASISKARAVANTNLMPLAQSLDADLAAGGKEALEQISKGEAPTQKKKKSKKNKKNKQKGSEASGASAGNVPIPEEFMEYAVPDQLMESLAASGARGAIPTSLSVKRKRAGSASADADTPAAAPSTESRSAKKARQQGQGPDAGEAAEMATKKKSKKSKKNKNKKKKKKKKDEHA